MMNTTILDVVIQYFIHSLSIYPFNSLHYVQVFHIWKAGKWDINDWNKMNNTTGLKKIPRYDMVKF